MKVTLKHITPLQVCADAIRTCWSSEDKSDKGSKDKALIDRVGNKFKHSSTLEHIVMSFEIDGISRACLMELTRHRISSFSVRSTRYTLAKKLKDEKPFNCDFARVSEYCVLTEDERVNTAISKALDNTRELIAAGISNDIVKYSLPESFKTKLTWTVNMRSFQNFMVLRSSRAALLEIRQLAKQCLEALPEEYLYLVPGV